MDADVLSLVPLSWKHISSSQIPDAAPRGSVSGWVRARGVHHRDDEAQSSCSHSLAEVYSLLDDRLLRGDSDVGTTEPAKSGPMPVRCAGNASSHSSSTSTAVVASSPARPPPTGNTAAVSSSPARPPPTGNTAAVSSSPARPPPTGNTAVVASSPARLPPTGNISRRSSASTARPLPSGSVRGGSHAVGISPATPRPIRHGHSPAAARTVSPHVAGTRGHQKRHRTPALNMRALLRNLRAAHHRPPARRQEVASSLHSPAGTTNGGSHQEHRMIAADSPLPRNLEQQCVGHVAERMRTMYRMERLQCEHLKKQILATNVRLALLPRASAKQGPQPAQFAAGSVMAPDSRNTKARASYSARLRTLHASRNSFLFLPPLKKLQGQYSSRARRRHAHARRLWNDLVIKDKRQLLEGLLASLRLRLAFRVLRFSLRRRRACCGLLQQSRNRRILTCTFQGWMKDMQRARRIDQLGQRMYVRYVRRRLEHCIAKWRRFRRGGRPRDVGSQRLVRVRDFAWFVWKLAFTQQSILTFAIQRHVTRDRFWRLTMAFCGWRAVHC